MFVARLKDASVSAVRVPDLHRQLVEHLRALGYTDVPSLTDLYLLSSPKAHKSRRLQAWQEVFQLEHRPHERVPTAFTSRIV